MEFEFEGEVIEWRGPAPFLFVRLPDDVSEVILESAALLTYGWGCIPARAVIGSTAFTTSLFPREEGYLLPLKVVVQRAEGVGLGDVVTGRLMLTPR
ncbi:DUF1905 domain-containing protein [Tessaracoccus antarcticus]|uniref:DUF1905 domain-containing protein n=1 Tax=Tessaracoccus antarcticus TaxID=2479848 RepID=A0A3M0GHV7_9ACTN|nr:DUF1905 domain-containing protein [Tessaracoccus antarcticus]RMB62242.1 DUF1905 domain-containing protein [Tessaracoccus antarcticus]